MTFVSSVSCSGPPDQTVRYQQANFEPGKCLGLNVNYSFIADHSEKPFYESTRTSIPFNFANSFDFDLPSAIRSRPARPAYANVTAPPGQNTLQIRFFSADGVLVHQAEFPGGIIECGSNQTTVSYTRFVSVPWPGSDQRITVDFSRLGNEIQLETNVEIVPRVNPFNEKGYRQYKAEFKPYE